MCVGGRQKEREKKDEKRGERVCAIHRETARGRKRERRITHAREKEKVRKKGIDEGRESGRERKRE